MGAPRHTLAPLEPPQVALPPLEVPPEVDPLEVPPEELPPVDDLPVELPPVEDPPDDAREEAPEEAPEEANDVELAALPVVAPPSAVDATSFELSQQPPRPQASVRTATDCQVGTTRAAA